jgi:hypothetical protein
MSRRAGGTEVLDLPQATFFDVHPVLLEIVKDVAAFLIGAAVSWLLTVGHGLWRTREARRFWRPFLSDDLCIILGRFKEFSSFERSGFLGVGDAIALAELQRYLARIGRRRGAEVIYADQCGGDDLHHTIICLGGPDANSVTLDALKLIKPKLQYGDPSINEVAIQDTAFVPPHLYLPHAAGRDGSTIDYGIILRVPNPFAKEKTLLIIGGSFGHGTWAGARYVTSHDFLNQALPKTQSPLEYLVETRVVRDTPQAIRLLVARIIDN